MPDVRQESKSLSVNRDTVTYIVCTVVRYFEAGYLKILQLHGFSFSDEMRMCFIQLLGHAVTPVDALMYFRCRIYRNVMFTRQVSDSFDMISMIDQYKTASEQLSEQGLTINSRMINDSKISDHHAIIVTENIKKS